MKRLIPDNDRLRADLNKWEAGDFFVGRVRLKPGEENLLLYLQSRGVVLFPSPLSQMLSRSKAMQAQVFAGQMVPGTRVINDLHDLVAVLGDPAASSISKVVTKHDRRNGGTGVNLWPSVEDLYNQVSLGVLPFPFVLQPFVDHSRDIRVVILDDYREAYWRSNPNNFRNNLHFGGKSEPAELSGEQNAICDQVMRRGQFVYAHLDLLVTSEGKSYLAEISLQGGIRGAAISGDQYREKISGIHNRFLQQSGVEVSD
ncbi:MAG: hypothetical protein KKG47_03595 [Proteobacteria bacterium]|nr:hypothetical protein [Pseudomonadota bacterium]MBU1739302.1 hypothetical protein [Pseudomonadota bacterium]